MREAARIRLVIPVQLPEKAPLPAAPTRKVAIAAK
jgi:hypothetical protein